MFGRKWKRDYFAALMDGDVVEMLIQEGELVPNVKIMYE